MDRHFPQWIKDQFTNCICSLLAEPTIITSDFLTLNYRRVINKINETVSWFPRGHPRNY